MNKKQVNIDGNRRNKSTKKPKKHKVLRTIGKVLLIIIILIALFVGGFVGYSTLKNGWGLKGLLQTAVGSETKLEDLDEFKILILGISEDISAALTDTIMVASYNPQTQKAVLLSIPRDTFVGDSKLNASSYDKINALYQQGGPEATLEAVNELTGLDIQYYLVISNNALVELVDEIGGVYFDVPIDMNYDSKKQDLHIHLKAGYQKLTGEQAEWLVRFRKNNNGTTYSYEYGGDDYGRMKTQREFLKAIAEQTLQLKNITKIGDLVDVVQRNVTTNIPDWNAVKDYIPYAVEFNMDNLETAALPGESTRIPAGTGLWFFLNDEVETKELIEELYSNEESVEGETPESGNTESTGSTENNDVNIEDVNIELLNGSGNSRVLTEVTNELKEEGYNVYKTGTTSLTSKTTIINKSNISSETTSDLKSILGTGIVSSGSSASDDVDITIIIGKDYN